MCRFLIRGLAGKTVLGSINRFGDSPKEGVAMPCGLTPVLPLEDKIALGVVV
jgi:hypothetical protein